MKGIHSQKGAAMVEFAIVLPVLLLIVFGIIEFSLALYNKAVITNASREGARMGIVYAEPAITTGEITTTVENYCQDFLVSFGAAAAPATTVAGGPCGEGTSGNSLTVTVDYQYTFLVLPNFSNFLGPNLNLSAETVMRCE